MRVSRRPRVWAAWMLASALLLSGVFVASTTLVRAHATDEPATSGTTEGAQADGTPTDTEAVEFVVAPVDPVILASQTDAEFRVLLRNPGERSLPDGSIELSIGEKITGGSVITPTGPDSTPSGTGDKPPGTGDTDAQASDAPAPTVIATQQIDVTGGDAEQEFTISVPVADLLLSFSSERGVYRLYAKYVASDSSSDNALTAYAPIIWQGTNDLTAAVDLSVVVPLLFSADVQSMPTRAQLENAIPNFNSLLGFATRTRATLAIDPRILAAIRGYGDESPTSAQEFLARLERSTLTSFTLQYADADPVAQAAIGLDGLLTPNGLEFITRFGSWSSSTEPDAGTPGSTPENTDAPTAGSDTDAASTDSESTDAASTDTTSTNTTSTDAAHTDTPNPDAENSAPATVDTSADPVTGEPTLEALGAWPNGMAGAWPANGQVTAETLTLLRKSGLDTTVLSSSNVTLTGGPRATLGSSTAIVTDTELDSGVQLALQGATEAERELGTAQAQARLALAADTGVKGLILGVDRGGAAESGDTEAVLDALTSARWVNSVSTDEQAEGSATLQPGVVDDNRIAALETAVANEATVLKTRALLVRPEYLDSYQRLRLLNLLATRNAAPGIDFVPITAAYAERDDELSGGVSLVGTKKAQLVGVSSRIPVQLRNPLPFDAIVTLTVAPTSAALSMPERHFEKILLPEDSSEGVLVPVRSRVSSGESAILLSVTSVDGEHTTSTDVLPVSISTSVESIALAVLAAAAALLFGFGIWRSVRRRRQASGE